jgi:hypothetical protein
VRRLLLAPAALALLLRLPAPGDDVARLPGVSTWINGRDVHVEAKLDPALPSGVERRLVSGLPTTVVWRIRLYIFRSVWLDSERDERRYAVTATYRPVTGDYAVERRLDDRLLETRIVSTRDDARRAVSVVPGLPCFTLKRDLAGQRLVVRVKCVYAAGVTLGVVPTTAETDWVRSGIFEWTEPGT